MKSLLIRAEDKNIWERRCTIVPDDLQKIQSSTAAKSYIETSKKRYFSESDFINAGAEACSGMEKGDVIFGVKEIPVNKLLAGKTYFYFSHTIKGQKENMPMLKKIMDNKSTLIDYEKIEDAQGRRLVYFGPFAGDAGAIDILWLMGEYWKSKGIRTPFEQCKQALSYHSLAEAKDQFRKVGIAVETEGIPAELGPLVVGVLGYGNVSQGAQNILNLFPVEYIEPENLKECLSNGKTENNKLYVVIFKEEHMVKKSDGNTFDLQEYYEFPEKYESNFEQYLPYITILINATYWEKRYPKFVTYKALSNLSQGGASLKLQGIADITCDVNGSVECNVKSTDTGMPAYQVDPVDGTITDGHTSNGIVLLAVDNLPAELPKDASEFFSSCLTPFVPNILQSDFSKPLADSGLREEIQNAVIVYNGGLTDKYKYLERYL